VIPLPGIFFSMVAPHKFIYPFLPYFLLNFFNQILCHLQAEILVSDWEFIPTRCRKGGSLVSSESGACQQEAPDDGDVENPIKECEPISAAGLLGKVGFTVLVGNINTPFKVIVVIFGRRYIRIHVYRCKMFAECSATSAGYTWLRHITFAVCTAGV